MGPMRVIFANEFGRQVGARLEKSRPVTLVPWDPFDRTQDPLNGWDGEFVLFALGRPYPSALRGLDERLMEQSVRWSATVIRDRYLICGPLHKPGKGACWDCFQRRYLTLAIPPRTPDRERALDAAYDAHPGEVLSGFLPPLVGMAAAAAAAHHDDFDRLPTGALTVFDVLEGSVTATCVVPLHGCRCRNRKGPAGRDRFIGALPSLLNVQARDE
jgi:bacteriocin biosynthesis cyclodehydratase domain-containing protein